MTAVTGPYGNVIINVMTPQNLYGPQDEYESRQKLFVEKSKAIVQIAVQKIQEKSANELNFFNNLIGFLALSRKEIAQLANSHDKDYFGVRRDEDSNGVMSHTPLTHIYEKANECAVKNLALHMQSMKRDLKNFIALEKKELEIYGERKFSYEIQVLPPEKGRLIVNYDATPVADEVMRKLCEQSPTPPTEIEFLRAFKQSDTKAYNNDKMRDLLLRTHTVFASPKLNPITKRVIEGGNPANLKSDWILVTKRTEIDGKMYAMTQWLTWAYCNFQKDPIERMQDPTYMPVVTMIHQDMFLISQSLDECGKIFQKALNWNANNANIRDLKNQVALLRHIFAEAMPHLRGSAAIGEWLEQAIYQHHGFSCSYRPSYEKESVDIIAMTTLKYSDYLQRYHELVECAPLAKGNEN